MGQIPPSTDPFWSLVAIAQRLQAPGGCPWDRQQTVESLLPFLIEEAWEVHEAVHCRSSGPSDALEEELGDLLYTTLFIAMRGEQAGRLSLSRIFQRAQQKMVRRHPHVFGNRKAKNAQHAYNRWQAIKRKEKRIKSRPTKNFSKLLVKIWDALLHDPTAPRTLRGALKRSGIKRSRLSR